MWGHMTTSWWFLLLSSASILVDANFVYPTHADDLFSTYFRGFGRRLAPRQGKYQCQGEGFFADPNDCSKFYRCVDYGQGYGYVPFEFQCSSGTVYDASITACNHPWAVEGPCQANQVSSGEMISNPPPQGQVTGSRPPEPAPEPSPSQESNEIQGSPSNMQAVEDENNNEIEGASTGTGGDSKRPECKSEGFFANPDDCTKFYRCVPVENSDTYDVYTFDCGPGTVFNEEKQVCDHPSEVSGKCSSYVAPNPEPEPSGQGEMNEGSSSNQNEQPSESSTKAPGSSNENNQSGAPANSGENNQSGSQPGSGENNQSSEAPASNEQNSQPSEAPASSGENSQSSTESTSQTPASSEATSAPASSSESNDTSPEDSQQQQGNDCNKPAYKGECEEEGFFPVAGDCAKFYRCVSNGKPGSFSKYDFECGEGTVFDPDNSVCNHASAVQRDCDNPPQNSPQTQTTTEKTQEENENSGPPPSNENNPPPENNENMPPPAENNENTPPPSENTEAPKEPGSGESTTTASNQGESSTQSSTQSSQESTTKGPASGNSGNCSEEGFFAHPEDCKKFYRCVDNEKGGFDKYDFVCGEGTVFDPETSVCIHERDSTRDCKSSSPAGGESGGEQPPPESANQSGETTTASQGSSSEQTTPASQGSGEQTESSSSQPGSSTTGSPAEETGTEPNDQNQEGTTKSPGDQSGNSGECTSEGFYPHPEDCKKFYRCVDNGKGGLTKYDFDCAEGTVFDPELDVCNHERDVQRDCSATGTTQSPPGDDPTTQGTTLPPGDDGAQTTTSANIPDEQTDPPAETTPVPEDNEEEPTPPISPPCHPIDPNPPVVSCTMEGYYPDPSNCSNFYRCIDHNKDGQLISVYFFRCPGQKIYDPERNVCDKPENIQPPRDCSALTTTMAPESETQTSPPESQTTTVAPEETTTTQASTEPATTQQPEETTTSAQTTTSPSEETTTSPPEQETTTAPPEEGTTQPPDSETTTEEPAGSTKQPGEESTTPSSTDETPFETTTENTDEPAQTTTPMSPPSDNSTTDAPPSSCDCCNTEEGQSAYICPTGFRRHPKFCNRFYQCTDKDNVDIKILVFDCPDGLNFDTEMQKCVEPDQTEACKGEIGQTPPPSGRSRNSKVPVKVGRNALCPNTGFYTYDGDCHHFIQCREDARGNLRGQLKRCPDGFTFWEVSRRCELTARIAKKCNRRSNDVMAWDIPVDFGNIGRLSRQLLRMM